MKHEQHKPSGDGFQKEKSGQGVSSRVSERRERWGRVPEAEHIRLFGRRQRRVVSNIGRFMYEAGRVGELELEEDVEEEEEEEGEEEDAEAEAGAGEGAERSSCLCLETRQLPR